MFTMLTDLMARNLPVIGNLVEYESKTIRRVVRSSMAAESAALSKNSGRQLYLRLMVDSLCHGQPELRDTDRRVHPRVAGILVTDAKSVYDSLVGWMSSLDLEVRQRGRAADLICHHRWSEARKMICPMKSRS